MQHRWEGQDSTGEGREPSTELVVDIHIDIISAARHPLWGGLGACLGEGNPAVDETCLCDGERFSSTDPFGNPSCVLTNVLVTLYAIVAMANILLSALLVWDIKRFSQLPLTTRRVRRAVIWQRLSTASSIYTGVSGVVFVTTTAMARESQSFMSMGVLQGWYTIAPPVGLGAALFAVELWVDSLPNQLLAADSMVTKMKAIAEERGVVTKLAMGGMSTGVVLGVASFVFSNPRQIISGINILCCACAIFMVMSISFVGVHISHLIDKASRQAPATGRDFYSKAKKRMWLQATALCTLGLAWVAVVLAWELTRLGRGTQTIPWLVMNIIASSGYTMATHSSRLKNIDQTRAVTVFVAPNKGGEALAIFSIRSERSAARGSSAASGGSGPWRPSRVAATLMESQE